MKILKNILAISIAAFTLSSCSILDELLNSQIDPDLTLITNPVPPTINPAPVVLLNTYNPCPNGCPATGYDINAGSTDTYTFDPVTGYLISSINSVTLETVSYIYDSLGNVLSETITSGTNTSTITYTYGSNGKVSSSTDGYATTNYYYNASDFLTSSTYTPLTGPIEYTTYYYDANNRLTSKVNGTTITTYTYDANGYVSTWTTDDGMGYVTNYAFSYDAQGRMSSVVLSTSLSGTSVSTYDMNLTYDLSGNLTDANMSYGTMTAGTQYTYNPGTTNGRPVNYFTGDRYFSGVNFGAM